jgi:hypothetical protein
MNLMTLLRRVLRGLFWHFFQKQLKMRIINQCILYTKDKTKILTYNLILSHIYNITHV